MKIFPFIDAKSPIVKFPTTCCLGSFSTWKEINSKSLSIFFYFTNLSYTANYSKGFSCTCPPYRSIRASVNLSPVKISSTSQRRI